MGFIININVIVHGHSNPDTYRARYTWMNSLYTCSSLESISVDQLIAYLHCFWKDWYWSERCPYRWSLHPAQSALSCHSGLHSRALIQPCTCKTARLACCCSASSVGGQFTMDLWLFPNISFHTSFTFKRSLVQSYNKSQISQWWS